jgi:hypothetical protein
MQYREGRPRHLFARKVRQCRWPLLLHKLKNSLGRKSRREAPEPFVTSGHDADKTCTGR